MSTGIHGHIEGWQNGQWAPLFEIDTFVEDDYGIFALLFGVRPRQKQPEPLAAKRGRPVGTTMRATDEEEGFVDYVTHSATWLSWYELSMHWQWLANYLGVDYDGIKVGPGWQALFKIWAALEEALRAQHNLSMEMDKIEEDYGPVFFPTVLLPEGQPSFTRLVVCFDN